LQELVIEVLDEATLLMVLFDFDAGSIHLGAGSEKKTDFAKLGLACGQMVVK